MNALSTLRAFAATLRIVSRRNLAASVVALVGLSVTEGFGLLLLLPLLQLVGVEAGPSDPSNRMVAAFSAVFTATGVRPTLAIVLGIYVMVAALQTGLQRWQARLSAGIQEDVVTALRCRVYEAIARTEWVFFVRSRASDFLHVLTNEIGRVGTAAYYALDLAISAAIALVYFALAFKMSPAITSLVVLAGLGLGLALRRRLGRARSSGEQVSASTARLYAAISEHLASMKTIKSYGDESRHVGLFGQLSDELRNVSLRSTDEYGRFRQYLAMGSTAGLAIIVYTSVGLLAIPTTELLLLLFVFARLMPRLIGLYERAQTLAVQLPAFAAVTDLERRCQAAAQPVAELRQTIEFHREIRFAGVTFDYQGEGQSPAVQGIDLVIEAGSTTAIVGPSGAGKSTLADLLLGLLHPTTGRILIDGRPLESDELASWRDQIGYVPQETLLFHATVRANLLWARPAATEEDLWCALRLAAADAFVARLPAGLDTVVGDRGVLVSGGERQRLSLARALIRRPRLLILDEATSSLDSENEARIQRAIDKLHQQMTIVIITHRLSTIRSADVIHVVDRGRLVESGSWEQLTHRAGRFRELSRAQGLDEGPKVTLERPASRPTAAVKL